MSLTAADTWLYTTMRDNAALHNSVGDRIYIDQAPEGTAYPMIVISAVASTQESQMSTIRVLDNELWQVAVWGQGPSYSTIGGIADSVRSLLHAASSASILGVTYESSTRIAEETNGTAYRAIVLEFRIYVK